MEQSFSITICNNCGKSGHLFHQCKMPIISAGIIVCRKNKNAEYEFLMIRRKHTLGFMDFMRGKYSIYNKDYILNIFNEMTLQEKEFIKTMEFKDLWGYLWNRTKLSEQYKCEYQVSSDKFNALRCGILIENEFHTLNTLIEESNQVSTWEEPEWGFPKGRRNHNENDLECAYREFIEETGYKRNQLRMIENILPFEEIFTGSNYKSYKHKYYLMMLQDTNDSNNSYNYDTTEVSKIEWKTYEQCIECIRCYNLEKKSVITNIYKCLEKYIIL